MKMPIKKKWFDKLGKNKKFEFRDAHITFICEETKEKKCFEIDDIGICPLITTMKVCKINVKEARDMFDDGVQVFFRLGKECVD